MVKIVDLKNHQFRALCDYGMKNVGKENFDT